MAGGFSLLGTSPGAPTNPSAPAFGIGGLGGAGTVTAAPAPALTGSAWNDAGGQGALDVQANLAQRKTAQQQQQASSTTAPTATQMYFSGGTNG